MGLCSSIAQWPLTPHVCSWATRKLSVFIKKPYARQSGFHSFRAMGWRAFYNFFIGFIFMGKLKKISYFFCGEKRLTNIQYFWYILCKKPDHWWKQLLMKHKISLFLFSTIRRYRNFFWNFYISYLQLMKINHYMYMCMLCNIITRFIYF